MEPEYQLVHLRISTDLLKRIDKMRFKYEKASRTECIIEILKDAVYYESDAEPGPAWPQRKRAAKRGDKREGGLT